MMRKLTIVGQSFIAAAMIAFGIQHFIYLDFVTRAFPALPQWIPLHPFFACLFGAFLCLTGMAILLKKQGRTLALLLGGSILAVFALFLLPALLADPTNVFLIVNSGKALVLAGANFIVAGTLPETNATTAIHTRITDGIMRTLERFIPLGRCFLAGFLIMAGVIHFIYPDFVAALIPSWIPAHLFWAYFTGVALIAGGTGIIVARTTWLAATLSGGMIFLWVVLLHIPRALANLHDANETTAAFEALAMCGAAILVAIHSTSEELKGAASH